MTRASNPTATWRPGMPGGDNLPSGPAGRPATPPAVLYCLFGGAGTLVGPVIGTFAIELLNYGLSDIDAIRQIWPVILGLILLVVVMFQPAGLLGLIVSARERIGSSMPSVHKQTPLRWRTQCRCLRSKA